MTESRGAFTTSVEDRYQSSGWADRDGSRAGDLFASDAVTRSGQRIGI